MHRFARINYGWKLTEYYCVITLRQLTEKAGATGKIKDLRVLAGLLVVTGTLGSTINWFLMLAPKQWVTCMLTFSFQF